MAVAESCQAWQGWKNGVEKVEIAAEWTPRLLSGLMWVKLFANIFLDQYH